MIRDLIEDSIRMVRVEKIEEVYERSKVLADEKNSRNPSSIPFEKRKVIIH